MNSFIERLYQSHQACTLCPSPTEVKTTFDSILGVLFPDFCSETFANADEFTHYINRLQQQLETLILNSSGSGAKDPKQLTARFFQKLPDVYDYLLEDVVAMYEGDPAAKSKEEVVRTYPGFFAIAAYRLAHELQLLDVQGIPRIITEYAHGKTGIDIHPAARIGRHFCIDHGTGIVIGETAVIGHHVKLYQGVTLGALSIDKKDAETKRHPTLEDRVVVYAGATILGGPTTVGHDSIVGGNVWLTRSVPPHSKIYYQSRMVNGDRQETDTIVIKAGAE
jgi:serine O-acetyltransferase